MARRPTPAVLPALNAALKEAKHDALDGATIALARRYAHELDDASVVARAVTRVIAKVAKLDGGAVVAQELTVLASRIEEVHVAGLIGPKLLAALEELQLTPNARAGVIAGGGGGDAGDPAKSKLDELRSRRENRASSVDPSA